MLKNPKAIAIFFFFSVDYAVENRKKVFNFRTWRLTQHIQLLSKFSQKGEFSYHLLMFVMVIK